MDIAQITALMLGTLIGFVFWKIISGKHEGDKIEKSLRFIIKGYYIHIHHWIWCSILLGVYVAVGFQNHLVIGILVGSIVQGLTYRDRLVIVYRKERYSQIYSKWYR
ncbi:MAG: hypothetical protein KBB54_01305 [Candidatus Pacebacteria bacterium]|nr:hypothetical protein [Candidatus Paceibacterota bacterium]MDQ5950008.1 hypothetical protein [Patescibacteria group bacterium]